MKMKAQFFLFILLYLLYSNLVYSEGNKIDELWFNTRDTSIVTSSIILEKEKEYKIVIKGSYSYWSAWEWESGWEGILQEDLPIYPDDTVINSYAGVDVCYVYACPVRRHCSIDNFPSYASNFEYSLDNGENWLKINNLCHNFNETHTYDFIFKGEGFPIKFRLIDYPNSDNYGLFKIEIFLIEKSTSYQAGFEAGKQYCIENPSACGITDRYEEGIEEGKRLCIENPSACGIDLECENNDNSMCEASFNLFTNTLHIPCLRMGENYWLDLSLINSDPVQLELRGFGKNE